MNEDIPRVIVGKAPSDYVASRTDPEALWKALGIVAGALSIAGLIDIVLAFVPARSADPVWLFTVLSGVLTGLPILVLGLVGGILAGAAAGGRRRAVLYSILAGLTASAVLVGIAVFLLRTQTVLALARPEVHGALWKQIARTLLAGVTFGAVLAYAAFSGLRVVRQTSTK